MTSASAPTAPAAALRGWRLTGLLAAALVAMSTGVLATQGTGEAGVRALVRATARSSALLFVLVYLARPAQSLWPGAFARALLRERRYLGVAVAVSHAIHLAGIVALARVWPATFAADATTVVVGGLGFVLLFAMAATSSDAAVRRLGRARWRTLHRSGVHLLWFIFLVTFAGNLAIHSAYAAAVALLLAAGAVRAAAFLRGRRRARV